MSLVIHPRSPMVPTVHLNVRYFELTDARRARRSTPGSAAAPTSRRPIRSPRTRVHFHRALKAVCDRHHPSFYPRFKSWCDHYFVNTHRGDERRGIGGIFFDNLRDGESGLGLDQLVAFAQRRGRRAARGVRADRRAAARTCPTASGSGGCSWRGGGGTSSSTWCTTGARCSGCRPTRGSRAC